MIHCKGVSHYFNQKPLFKNLDLIINDGERIAIIGPSGCGKSTLLKFFLGLIRTEAGNICIDGQDVSSLDENGLRKLRLKMGMLFQSAALFDSFSIFENIAFPLIENFGYTMKTCEKKVSDALELVGLPGYHNKMPYELSGGQQKRVGLARAIITKPKYIFYDEPTTGLDPIMSTSIENLIVKLNESMNITSIIVSHQKSTILRTSDQIYMVYDYNLRPPETPSTISDSSDLVIKAFMKGNLSS